MSKQCKIVEDLLPLYHDGVCSEESKQLVEEHLSQCEQCRSLLHKIDEEIIAPAKSEDVKALEGISEAVRKGWKKALRTGVSITLAAVLLLFAGFSTWWYFHEYRYYSAFAEGQTPVTAETNIENSFPPSENYTWRDDIYRYDVSVPGFMGIGGFAGMERLDDNETHTAELAITRWENEKYIFHVTIKNADKEYYFIIDSKFNLHGNYSEAKMKEKYEELDECADEVKQIIEDAIKMWDFIAER